MRYCAAGLLNEYWFGKKRFLDSTLVRGDESILTAYRESKLKILVVDDQQDIVTILSKWLSRRGHEVTGTTHGMQAISCIERDAIDLAILDLTLRDAEG